MKFGVEYESKMTVEFSDHLKIREVFVDGDWKDTFCPLEDVGEVATYIAYWIMQGLDEYDSELKGFVSVLEGVGRFVDQGHGCWLAVNPAYGEIRVKVLSSEQHVETVEIEEQKEQKHG